MSTLESYLNRQAYAKKILSKKDIPKEVNKDSILSVNFKREHKRK